MHGLFPADDRVILPLGQSGCRIVRSHERALRHHDVAVADGDARRCLRQGVAHRVGHGRVEGALPHGPFAEADAEDGGERAEEI